MLVRNLPQVEEANDDDPDIKPNTCICVVRNILDNGQTGQVTFTLLIPAFVTPTATGPNSLFAVT